ncbi:MAG: nucleotide exchange factor GrpE [Saprospiraceae bacterium]|nr:nucleotide exchange factor GrpE [Saprospiraceae bacterium]MDW8483340.1 nucleotide exchange factor GrpE [Saprospiraceae bacterium]
MNDNSKNQQPVAEEQHAELAEEQQPTFPAEVAAEAPAQAEVDTSGETPAAEGENWQQRYEELHNKYLYLLSDFQNYKRHVARERLEMEVAAGRDIMSALLPILDDFDRAAKNNALDEGIALIHHKLLYTLQSKGLQLIEVQVGEELNPDTHEAVAEVPAPSEQLQGKIVDIVEKGYRLGERILRHAKVVVGK